MLFKKFILLTIFLLACKAYAAPAPGGQSAGSILKQEGDINRGRELEERIEKRKPEPSEESAAKTSDDPGPKTLVKSIKVEGAKLLKPEEIQKITAPFEGRELSIGEMQQVADLISDAYRQKGFVTSRAYIPVQSIKDNVLTLKVLEARAGTVEFQGNKHFKSESMKRELNLGSEGYFDFSALQQSLVYINEHPDRLAKAVLAPGKEPGTTDVIIQVADQQPMHLGFEYNNYASRFVDRDQYALIFEHNNVTAHDDLLYIKGQASDNSRLTLQQLRYMFPLSRRWDIGFFAVNSHLRLGREFSDLDATGDAKVFGLFGSRKLIKTQKIDLRLNVGFDYKSIRDRMLGSQVSNDQLRVVKFGFDLDFEDPWGRNIMTANLNSGIANFLGSGNAKDLDASRVGAGARFDKGEFTFFHLHALPAGMTLLWKNFAQTTKHNLPASEQFQIGGALSVRGYPPAEFSGDSGIYSSPEISIPWYFLSRNAKVPFTKEDKLYDALRFVVFYDLAMAHLNNPQAGEERNQTLRGYGYGLRLNIRDNVTLRVEVGYPHGRKASDRRSAHPWVEFTLKY